MFKKIKDWEEFKKYRYADGIIHLIDTYNSNIDRLDDICNGIADHQVRLAAVEETVYCNSIRTIDSDLDYPIPKEVSVEEYLSDWETLIDKELIEGLAEKHGKRVKK